MMTTDFAQLTNDQEEALRLVLDGRQVSMWTAIPAIVQRVNFATMTCDVQPAIQGMVVDKNNKVTPVNLPLLINCPIVFPSAGGFTITLPLEATDEVLVVFASRCIDAWWQSGGFNNLPMELRMHDLSDGFAIPGPRSVPEVISNISTTNLQIRNDEGTTYVEISDDGKIRLVSPVEIDITAPLVNVTASTSATVTSPTVDIIASDEVNITSPLVNMSGNLIVTGIITGAAIGTATGGTPVTGAVTAASAVITGQISAGSANISGAVVAGTVTAAGISLTTHVHTGVQTGPNDTGGPI